MSYQEKRTITNIVTGAAVLAAYLLYAFGKTGPGVTAPEDWKAWAATMLVFIGIGIVAIIVIQIVFHILLSIAIAVQKQVRTGKCDDKEVESAIKADMVEDERDKLIELKSSRISFGFGGMGFIAGLLALVLGYSPVVMINLIFLSFSAGSIVEGLAQLLYYRRGVKNG
jgi:hypothetical protein